MTIGMMQMDIIVSLHYTILYVTCVVSHESKPNRANMS